MILHPDLATRLDERFGTRFEAPVELKLDALLLRLDNGVILEARIAAPDAYAIAWVWGDAELRIDTAPVHPELATFPHHVHGADGRLRADPLTVCGADPFDNLVRVVDALLEDPLLGAPPGTAP